MTTVFDHTPIRPVRQDVIGEVVFMDAWLELMAAEPSDPDVETPNGMLNAVLAPLMATELNQRHATVAASVIRWLGTNNGQGFLHFAQEMAIKLNNAGNGFTAAWAIENRRESWKGFVRTVDQVLRPELHIRSAGQDEPERLSADDCETAEAVIVWLAEGEGERFLKRCQERVASKLREQRQTRMALHRQA